MIVRQPHHVFECHHPRVGLRHARFDDHLFIEMRRIVIPAVRFDHRQQHAVFKLHVFIPKSERLAIFDARHLHPHQVIGVIDHAHLIGLGIAHTNCCLLDMHAGTNSSSGKSSHRFRRRSPRQPEKQPARAKAGTSTAACRDKIRWRLELRMSGRMPRKIPGRRRCTTGNVSLAAHECCTLPRPRPTRTGTRSQKSKNRN
jgi:hypothetical protein